MDLDQQLQILINHAPKDGATPQLMQAIAPVLKLLAGQLRHPQYYIRQGLNQNWLTTTLSNRLQPDMEKNVIYAFPTHKDAISSSQVPKSFQVIAVPVPVTHILFQLVAMPDIHSLVFFETPENLATGTEVRREDLQNLIQTQLQQLSNPKYKSTQIPPDIC